MLKFDNAFLAACIGKLPLRILSAEERIVARTIDNPNYVAPSAVGETESEEVSEEVGTEVFTCPTCGKTYTSESWFNKHLLTHADGNS